MKKITIKELTSGAKKYYGITGDEYKQRYFIGLNDRINAGYYRDYNGFYYMKLNSYDCIAGTRQEIKHAALLRAYRFRHSVSEEYTAKRFKVVIKTTLPGFKQWCEIEKRIYGDYRFYRLTNKNGRYIDIDGSGIENAVYENGEFITKIKGVK